MSIKTRRHAGSTSLVARFMVGTALSAITMASAQAQTATTTETVVVTGTSIRGEQPAGSPLITVGRADIEASGAQTVVQLLASVPQIQGFGGTGTDTGMNGFDTTIHNIGNQSSSATLSLIDGHRFPTQGLTESIADPSIIPASALERVEILPDGASAIYGSDAVGGVVNFITRKDYTGIEAAVQTSLADHYMGFTGSAVLGHNWNGGSVLVAYDYTGNSQLSNAARPTLNSARQDILDGPADPTLFIGIPTALTGAGTFSTTPAAGPGTTGPYNTAIPYPSLGLNTQNFNCPVATIAQKSSSTTAYLYNADGLYDGPAYTTASSTTSPNQGVCDDALTGSADSSTTRNNVIMVLRQQLSDDLSFDVEMVYGTRINGSIASGRGTLSAVAFGPTATAANTGVTGLTAGNINPFYQGNATTGTNSEYIRYDFYSLLGPPPPSKQYNSNFFVSSGLAWDLGNDREITISGTAGESASYSTAHNLSTAEELLALNGTTSTNGTPSTATLSGSATVDIYGLGHTSETQSVLTTSNALDVWDPAATNKTSAAVKASIEDNGTFTNAQQGLQDLNAKFDGPIFDLPAGAVKIAVGGEFLHQTFDEFGDTTSTVATTRSSAAAYRYSEGRQIYSSFVEVNAPLISPEMNIPGVESLTIDFSGRYDKYSDVGDTINPKVGLDWLITDGLKARADWGTSFVAPAIHDAQAINSQSAVAAASTPGSPVLANSTVLFNSAQPFNGGAGIVGTWVSTAPSCATGGGTPVDAGGIASATSGNTAVGCKISLGAANTATSSFGLSIAGGGSGIKPAHGRTTSVGFDFDLGKMWDPLQGLSGSVSYYDVTYRGAITSVGVLNNIAQDTYFAPIGGWTPTSAPVVAFEAGRPINTVIQPTIWAVEFANLQNAYNLWENGIDFSVNYSLKTSDWGTFRAGMSGSTILRYTQQAGNVSPLFDVVDSKNAPRYSGDADVKARFSLGWSMDGFNGTLSMDYVHPQHGTSSTFPYNLPGPGRGAFTGSETAGSFISAGNTEIPAEFTWGLNTSYVIPKGLMSLPDVVTAGTSVSFNIDDLFDNYPEKGLGGTAGGSDYGRMITIGIRKKF